MKRPFRSFRLSTKEGLKMSLKRLTKKTEFYVALILIAFCLIIQARSGQFFTPNNIVDLLRSLTIPMMFAVGEMMVLISGGVDCSVFPGCHGPGTVHGSTEWIYRCEI